MNTVYDKVSNMSLKEMSKWLCRLQSCFSCPVYDECQTHGLEKTESINGYEILLKKNVE